MNLAAPERDQGLAASRSGTILGGHIQMDTIGPENTTDPIPLRTSPPGVGTIMIRFVGLLIVVTALLTLIWNR